MMTSLSRLRSLRLITRGAPNCLANRAESIAREQAHQSALDFANQSRTLINQAAIQLNQIRTGADVTVRILRAGDSPDPDNRHSSLQMIVASRDRRARQLLERVAAEA